jgi:hypothetical protein
MAVLQMVKAALINAHSDPGFDKSSIHFTRPESPREDRNRLIWKHGCQKVSRFRATSGGARGGFWNPIRGSGFLLSASRGMAFQAQPRANFYSPLFGVSDARVSVAAAGSVFGSREGSCDRFCPVRVNDGPRLARVRRQVRFPAAVGRACDGESTCRKTDQTPVGTVLDPGGWSVFRPRGAVSVGHQAKPDPPIHEKWTCSQQHV